MLVGQTHFLSCNMNDGAHPQELPLRINGKTHKVHVCADEQVAQLVILHFVHATDVPDTVW